MKIFFLAKMANNFINGIYIVCVVYFWKRHVFTLVFCSVTEYVNGVCFFFLDGAENSLTSIQKESWLQDSADNDNFSLVPNSSFHVIEQVAETLRTKGPEEALSEVC